MAEFFPGWAKWMGPNTTPQGNTGVAPRPGLFETIQSKIPGKELVERNMKQVGPAMKEVFGERIYPKGLPAPETAAKTAAKAGPLAGLLAVYEGGSQLNEMFNPAVRMPKIRKAIDENRAKDFVSENPEVAARAQAGMEGIAQRAAQAGTQAVRQGASQYIPPAGPVPMAPTVDPEIETQRQVLENGAKEQLRTNQLSRPKAAEAVVEADAARSGTQLTPDEKKVRVAEETASMKTMDNSQLSRYLSYALIGAGLIASHVDKSGNAGKAFAGSLNAQLDRNQQARLQGAKQQAEAQANATKAAQKEREIDLKERGLLSEDAYRKGTLSNNERKTTGLLDKWEQDAALAQQKLGAYRDRTAAQAAKSGKSATAPTLTYKDNKELVESNLKARGIKADKGVVEATAQQLMNLQKNYPDLTVNEQMDLVNEQFEMAPGEEEAWWDFTGLTGSDPKLKVRQ